MVQPRGNDGGAARPEGGLCIHVARHDARTEGVPSTLAKTEQTPAVLVEVITAVTAAGCWPLAETLPLRPCAHSCPMPSCWYMQGISCATLCFNARSRELFEALKGE